MPSQAATPRTGSTSRAAQSRRHNRETRKLWWRCGQLSLGSLVIGVGIALLVWARLGMVPVDVLHLGAARTFGWTFGGGIIAVQSILLLVSLTLRIMPGPGTVVAFLAPAVSADVLLSLLPRVEALPVRLAAFAAGGFIVCLGVATYLIADLGRLPRDGIVLVLAGERRRSGARAKHVAWVRVAMDLAFVAGGVLLLGPAAALRTGALSVGTAVLAVGSGPLIALLWRRLGNNADVLSGPEPEPDLSSASTGSQSTKD